MIQDSSKKRYWLRGGLIAVAVAAAWLLIVSILTSTPGGISQVGFLIPFFGVAVFLVGAVFGGVYGKYGSSIRLFWKNTNKHGYLLPGGAIGFLIGFFVGIAIPGLVAGAIIGWLYGKIKNKQHE